MHNYSTVVEKGLPHHTVGSSCFWECKARVAGSSHDRSTEGSTEDIQHSRRYSMFLMGDHMTLMKSNLNLKHKLIHPE